MLPDFQRFADQPTEEEASLDGVSEEQLNDMTIKAEQELDEMNRLLSKSQSKDQIDQRAEECIKKFKGVYYKTTRKNLAYVLLPP